MAATSEHLESIIQKDYAPGFVTDLEADTLPPGLNEDVIRAISKRKNEPAFMLEWRLKAYAQWLTLTEPHWAYLDYTPVDYQSISYYSAPKVKESPKSLEEVDPKLIETYKNWAFLSMSKSASRALRWTRSLTVSLLPQPSRTSSRQQESFSARCQRPCNIMPTWSKNTWEPLSRPATIFCRAQFSCFSDGSFVYIPKGVRCPMELSTYFRINAANTGQFERTLIIADEGSHVSYLEGCTAPMRDENQLHAAVVELVALEGAEIKYSTVQNWYPGDAEGRGGIYNFVTKRGDCRGNRSKISWTQVETGSAITWKYPSCILRGDDSVGEFYSVAVSNHCQQADTGTKMIHIGRNTRSTIISKGISAGRAQNTYRGQVKILKRAENARNYTQCDSLLIGDRCGAHTFPAIEVREPSAQLEHEATTAKISEDQLFFCQQRGLSAEDAVSMIVNGFCKEVFKELPMEFAVEAQALLGISLEGSVG